MLSFFKKKYKKANNIEFVPSFSDYKGTKSAFWSTYITILSPILTVVLFTTIFVVTGGYRPEFFGHLNTLPLVLPFITLFIFVIIDIPKLVTTKVSIFSLKTFIKKYPEVLFLSLMLLWIIISGFLSIGFPKNFAIYVSSPDGDIYLQECMLFYFSYFLTFICAFSVRHDSFIKRFLIGFIVSSTVTCLLNILFHATWITTLGQFCNSAWSIGFVNNNHYAYYLAIAITIIAILFMLAKSFKVKVILIVLFTVHSVVMIFNDTLGCMLSVLLGLILIPVLVAIARKKVNIRHMLPLGIYLLLSILCTPFADGVYSTYTSLIDQIFRVVGEFFSIVESPTDESNMTAGTSRWGLWIDSVNTILKYPIFGDGELLEKPHNEYLQYAEHFGIPCLVFYVVALVIIAVKTITHLRDLSDISFVFLGALFVYLLGACFGNTMPHTTPFFIVVLALSIVLLNKDIDKANQELVDVEKYSQGRILTDMQYIKRGYPHAMSTALLRREVVDRLLRASKKLPNGYKYLIYDAWRPYEVQKALYDEYFDVLKNSKDYRDADIDSIHSATKVYVAYPDNTLDISYAHSTGGAVDITIVDENCTPLDMGTKFDDFSNKAHTMYFEDKPIATSIRDNRRLLYESLVSVGFVNLESEWWHYSYKDMAWAEKTHGVAIYKSIYDLK